MAQGATLGAKDGELVEAEQAGPAGRMGLPRARILERLGDPSAPRAVSLIAIHQHGIPHDFPDEVVEEADRMKPAGLSRAARTCASCRSSPSTRPTRATTTTRSCAHADDDPKNAGGHVIWVAIADVAHFVRPGSTLDREARRRGNSSYFPTAWCRCCPTGCRAISARCTRACRALHRGAHADRHRRAQDLAPLPARADAIGGLAHLRAGPGRRGRRAGRQDRAALDEVVHPLFAAYRALVRPRARRVSRSTSTCPSARWNCPRRARSSR